MSTENFEDEIDNIVDGANNIPANTDTSGQEGGSSQGEGQQGSDEGDGSAEQANQQNNDQQQQSTDDAAAGSSTADTTAQTTQPQFDLVAYLKEISGGEIESEEVLKERLSRTKLYESEVNQLKSEKDNLFANDRIKVLNDLYKSGKTDEQIAEFEKLRNLGDLNQLSAKDILVQKHIADGYDAKTASRLVEREYGLDKLELNEEHQTDADKEELDFINKKMEVDAKKARESLQNTIDELGKPVSATDVALKEAASKQAYQEKLKPFATKLSGDFPKRLEFGETSFDVPAEFTNDLQEDAMTFFMDREVNQENIDNFVAFKKGQFLAQNHEKIAKELLEKGKEIGRKEAESEFTNNGGVNRQGAVLNDASQTMSDADFAAEAMRMATE